MEAEEIQYLCPFWSISELVRDDNRSKQDEISHHDELYSNEAVINPPQSEISIFIYGKHEEFKVGRRREVEDRNEDGE